MLKLLKLCTILSSFIFSTVVSVDKQRVNQLKQFAFDTGMLIDVCGDSEKKISCEQPLRLGCSATPKSHETNPYTISLSGKTGNSKTQILGSVTNLNKGDESFLKYVIEVREINKKTEVTGKRIGKFLYNHEDRKMCLVTYTCNAKQKHSVGTSCPNAKSSKNFQWIAPRGWTGQVQFIATVIKSPAEFWIVESDLLIISD